MGGSDLPEEVPSEEDEGEEHPLKAGIDAAKEGDTASLGDIPGVNESE